MHILAVCVVKNNMGQQVHMFVWANGDTLCISMHWPIGKCMISQPQIRIVLFFFSDPAATEKNAYIGP